MSDSGLDTTFNDGNDCLSLPIGNRVFIYDDKEENYLEITRTENGIKVRAAGIDSRQHQLYVKMVCSNVLEIETGSAR